MTNDPSPRPDRESSAACRRRSGRNAALVWLLILLVYLSGYAFIRVKSSTPGPSPILYPGSSILPSWRCLEEGRILDLIYTPLYNAEGLFFGTRFVKTIRLD